MAGLTKSVSLSSVSKVNNFKRSLLLAFTGHWKWVVGVGILAVLVVFVVVNTTIGLNNAFLGYNKSLANKQYPADHPCNIGWEYYWDGNTEKTLPCSSGLGNYAIDLMTGGGGSSVSTPDTPIYASGDGVLKGYDCLYNKNKDACFELCNLPYVEGQDKKAYEVNKQIFCDAFVNLNETLVQDPAQLLRKCLNGDEGACGDLCKHSTASTQDKNKACSEQRDIWSKKCYSGADLNSCSSLCTDYNNPDVNARQNACSQQEKITRCQSGAGDKTACQAVCGSMSSDSSALAGFCQNSLQIGCTKEGRVSDCATLCQDPTLTSSDKERLDYCGLLREKTKSQEFPLGCMFDSGELCCEKRECTKVSRGSSASWVESVIKSCNGKVKVTETNQACSPATAGEPDPTDPGELCKKYNNGKNCSDIDFSCLVSGLESACRVRDCLERGNSRNFCESIATGCATEIFCRQDPSNAGTFLEYQKLTCPGDLNGKEAQTGRYCEVRGSSEDIGTEKNESSPGSDGETSTNTADGGSNEVGESGCTDDESAGGCSDNSGQSGSPVVGSTGDSESCNGFFGKIGCAVKSVASGIGSAAKAVGGVVANIGEAAVGKGWLWGTDPFDGWAKTCKESQTTADCLTAKQQASSTGACNEPVNKNNSNYNSVCSPEGDSGTDWSQSGNDGQSLRYDLTAGGSTRNNGETKIPGTNEITIPNSNVVYSQSAVYDSNGNFLGNVYFPGKGVR